MVKKQEVKAKKKKELEKKLSELKTPENEEGRPSAGLPDIDFKKFLGCGG